MYLSVIFFICQCIYLINPTVGHGYLADPPARSNAWLFDKDFDKCCQHFDYNQMFCGGVYRQWVVNKGKCSICGEPYDAQTKLFGMGDSMYLGKIVRTYSEGATIPVTVVLTANHLGVFQFRVCSLDNDPTQDATQSCLDANVLEINDDTTEYPIQSTYRIVHVNVTLPANLTCKHCVFQWKYRTGNSWGTSNTGRSCLGCGMINEEFYGCSDIAILGSDESIVTSNTITTEAVVVKGAAAAARSARKCVSSITFSPAFNIVNMIDQYCQTVCSNNCASENGKDNDPSYTDCLDSCSRLCVCESKGN